MKAGDPAPIIIIVGPTAVGKTGVSLALARRLGAEIVSADSRLVYRLMDIGTAKPTPGERGEIPHHLIDVVQPDYEYTCKEFEVSARAAIRTIVAGGRRVIVVGGSGLYVKALTDGIFEGPGRDRALRRKLNAEARLKGREHLWRRLREVDPEKASQIDPGNLRRTVRALEVYELTGTPMSELERRIEPLGLPSVKSGLKRHRDELYRLIDDRVDRMMEQGFLGEVSMLLDKGYGGSQAVRGSLGYSEMIQHLDGSLTLDEATDLIKRNTRRFAKRQMTWFRKDKEVTWIDITGRTDFDGIASEIIGRLPG